MLTVILAGVVGAFLGGWATYAACQSYIKELERRYYQEFYRRKYTEA